jgi:general secretion pathway protein F
MATFAYIARDQEGRKVEGLLAAATSQAVLAELHSRQLAPVQVKEVHQPRRVQRRISAAQLATVYRQLSDLLHAGVPLLRALRLVGRSKSNPRLAAVIATVADAVAEGDRLADAMAAHADVFPDVQIAMVRAGERGGFLEAVFQRMGMFLEHQAELRAKIVGNLIYPALLLAFMLIVIAVALVGIVPKFRDFYARIAVPWPTKMLLGASDAVVHYWLWVVLALVVMVFVVRYLLQQESTVRKLALLQLRIPVIGNLSASLAIGRFTRILGTLLENGIPMLTAMQISREAAGSVLLMDAIDDAADAVRNGESLAKPLARSGIISDDVVEMIAVGESANNLPHVLTTIADTLEKRIDRLLTLFVRLMEPALLLLMGAGVLFIFVALIVPMMRMSSSLSG